MIRFLIVGPPGSGKGTQASLLAEHYGIPAISTGDIFRSNMAAGTELGLAVKATLAAGDYVSDDLTNSLIRDRLAQDDAQGGFLLDGYPRTKAQVIELDRLLAEAGQVLDGVVELVVDTEEVVGRLVKRAGTEGRTDDTEAVIRHRQEMYSSETAPLVAGYRNRDLLATVDGSGNVAAVQIRLVTAIDELISKRKE